ncbi:ArsR/SmtB family transcription factor [Mesonia aestuariivivens]|uniref:Metalloregulator ArsR/SmtB family transcription factor n=1 Tax=Mesonia aestuariivivens TaxID=2796128 RepID=A0ABS6W2S3_9FLAO|nr:metalloregulator ArsR/SmtB family transcription factor [Mesonia aestuariivivens]MBW2962161.1 metalloregulator ArsR/SmtB family transcription factor [Mesonia aestuariivivens]
MGLTKSAIFTEEQNHLARMAKVLAHPARVAILQYLVKVNQCICGDLVHEIGLAQATISQHLRELKSAGIIKGNIEGTSVCYCIDAEVWQDVQQLFDGFFNINSTSQSDDCC